MSDLQHRKAAIVDVPGLAYFAPEVPAASRPAPLLPANDAAATALEQMFDYYAS